MDLREATDMLARTPRVLDAMLADLPSEWLDRNDGPDTWSAYDIVGHLLNGDLTDWLPRARMILDHGTDRTFAAVDRFAMLTQERVPATVLLERFRTGRLSCLDELAALELTADDLDRRGVHPAFGEVTLGQLIATWTAHDLAHVGQAAEVLARHYREAVGPWRAYLPALDRVAEAE